MAYEEYMHDQLNETQKSTYAQTRNGEESGDRLATQPKPRAMTIPGQRLAVSQQPNPTYQQKRNQTYVPRQQPQKLAQS